jgi:uncharacterized phosphosugar-binding protein
MSEEGQQYMDIIFETIRKVEKEQRQNILEAANLMAKAIAADELIHVYAGGGHTWLPVAEIFYRAGGLACINPFIDIGLSPFNQALHYMKFERLPGYGRAVVDYYDPKEGEVAIIVHNIGVNPATIDAALALKERKVKIIAISSSDWQNKVPKDHYIRHPSKLNLFDIADVCIDDYNPFGDAVINVEGLDTPIAPISNIVDFYIMHRLEIETVKKLINMGVKPPVWKSANVPGGDEYNRNLINKYMSRVKYL